MPLQRLAGEMHRIYKIGAGSQVAAAAAAKISGWEGYTRKAVLSMRIVIQLCGDRAEVMYRPLCLGCCVK